MKSVQHPSRSGRSARLWVTASSLALAAAVLAPQAASAAAFTAGSESDLTTAIQNANASADPSSTITLTGNFAIADPAALPAATKTINIVTAGFTMIGAAFNSSANLNVSGTGEVRLGGISTLSGYVAATNATLRLEGGGKLTTTGATYAQQTADIVVDGAGSVLTTNELRVSDQAGSNAAVTIQNGGRANVTQADAAVHLVIAGGATTHGVLTITGAGSRLDSAGRIQIGAVNTSGAGELIVSNGGAIGIGNGFAQVGPLAGVPITPPHVLVTGAGSTFDAPEIRLYKGIMEVLDGANVTAPVVLMGGLNGTSELTVSGAGSSVTSSGSFTLGGGNNNSSVVTLTDGGALNAIGLSLATAATRTGVLNIGGTEGGAPAAAGSLSAPSLIFGAGTGRLNFNHTDTNYTFSTPIVGGGPSSLHQESGVTHLTGNSPGYTGTAFVSGGELHVDGVLGGPTSQIGVNNGGVLGGSGTIGGNVAVTNGVIAPGNSPGTLTIAGDLLLTTSSLLDVEFGLSNVVGGPMNDLVKVGGNLTLDGTIDITVTAGGVFDAGLYRVINYGGALTNGGLTLGVVPGGATVTVQTAIPGQVNLINTAGLPVDFWDGGDTVGDGVLDGGNGTWNGAGTNWTTQTGAANNTYTPNSLVIFAAAPGTVNVGGVSSAGMQFAVDGYRLTGAGSITLLNATNTFRVGDGTADGKNYVTIIDTPILGAARGLTKTDLGTLILTGANTYSGITNVQAGTLLVNGTSAAPPASNTLIVGANGTLGGTGSIGGGVVNGTIAPGGLSNPGTLTTTFNLNFNASAKLNYRLGQAGTVGGALNDLLVVNGNLRLDGTLNVTESAGGSFLQGIYRLIDYTGTLTDQVLDVGTLPGGFTGTIDVSILHQVNLIANGAPPAGGGGGGGGADPAPPPMFNFWDGAGGAADGAVTGGDGTWSASPANWASAGGAANGSYTSATFAIFAGTPGTVTVDDTEGPITVSGMQFASDGYHLVGDAVTLSAGENVVRVGDGTSEGAKFVATVASELTGAGQLNKADGGTLVLTGGNTYSGGTTISGGALQLGDGGTSGSIAGDVVDDGTLIFNRSDETTFVGAISGGGTIVQAGSGATILTADSSAFAGRTQVRAGTLAVDGALGGQVEVLAGGRLAGTGQVGALTNGGVVAPGHGDVGVLSVAGGYAGAGGVLEMDAELGGDASPADRLVVHGATSGSTLVDVKRLGGAGAVTTDGILLVQVDGASDGTFALTKGDYRLGGEEALVAGAYAYVLREDDGGDWRLNSRVDTVAGPAAQPTGELITLYQPAAPIYEAYPQALAVLNAMGTMRQRTGDRQWSGDVGAGVWGRLEGGHTRLEPKLTTTGAELKVDRWKLQFGVDRALADDLAGGALVGGLTAHYGEASTDVASAFGRGDIDTKGYGIGANLTWMTTGGAYLDAQAQASWFDSDLTSQSLGERAKGTDGRGYGVSVEAGKAMAAGEGLNFTPQGQLTFSKVAFDSFTDSFGARVLADQGDSLVARLGLALDRGWSAESGEGRVYGLVNLSHEFLDGTQVAVSGAKLASRVERTWGGLAAGVSYGWGAGRFLVYGEATADTALAGFGDSYAAGGSAGFRMRF